jgi:SAM-dependent methyltransferase
MPASHELTALERAGRRRLYPSITDPNWLVLRRRREIFRKWLNELPVTSPVVLDVGGRVQPYRKLIRAPRHYCAIDLRPSPLLNALASAEQIPFRSAAFDLVICTQMIEYAPHPPVVLREIHRVLRPGAVLLLSAPTIFPRDSEHDRWRFFPAALRDLLCEFSTVEIVAETGSSAGLLRTIAVGCNAGVHSKLPKLMLKFTFFPAINCVGAMLDAVPGRHGSFTVNYSVRAIK